MQRWVNCIRGLLDKLENLAWFPGRTLPGPNRRGFECTIDLQSSLPSWTAVTLPPNEAGVSARHSPCHLTAINSRDDIQLKNVDTETMASYLISARQCSKMHSSHAVLPKLLRTSPSPFPPGGLFLGAQAVYLLGRRLADGKIAL